MQYKHHYNNCLIYFTKWNDSFANTRYEVKTHSRVLQIRRAQKKKRGSLNIVVVYFCEKEQMFLKFKKKTS